MYKKISSKILLRHPRLVVEEDLIELPTGERGPYLRYDYPGKGGVVIICEKQTKILFLKEYSYIPDRDMWQLPMGKVEEHETPELGAVRELQEETGLVAGSLSLVGAYHQNHRRSSKIAWVFKASSLKMSDKKSEIQELIQTVWLPKKDVSAKISSGDIADADTLSALRICGL